MRNNGEPVITIHFSAITALPEAMIQPRGPVSQAFLERNMDSFHQAAYRVNQMPYGNNRSSENALILFEDGFGSCLTKHGLITRLAEELELTVQRCEGFYPLTGRIVTGVDEILAEYGLPYIPRSHCFLSCENGYVDLTAGNCTGKNGLIETYLEIFRVQPEQSQSEIDEAYRAYYAEVCEVDPVFARLGVEGMLEALKRCQALNNALCKVK
jgi:hypothetical protein